MSRTAQPWPPVETDPAVPDPKAPSPGSKLGMHYSECFGCGDEQEAGLHLQSSVGTGMRVHSQFVVTEAHQGAPGLAHGGLLACAFDEAIGAAVGNLLRRPCVTARLETDFRHPVPVGSTLYITATLDGVSGRKIYTSAEGRLDSENGQVAVQARALFIAVDLGHFTEHGDPNSLEKLRRTHDDWDINP